MQPKLVNESEIVFMWLLAMPAALPLLVLALEVLGRHREDEDDPINWAAAQKLYSYSGS